MSPRRELDSHYPVLGKLLHDKRRGSGKSEDEFAAALERTTSWVVAVERGMRKLDAAEFIDWCRCCDAKPEDVLKSLLRRVR